MMNALSVSARSASSSRAGPTGNSVSLDSVLSVRAMRLIRLTGRSAAVVSAQAVKPKTTTRNPAPMTSAWSSASTVRSLPAPLRAETSCHRPSPEVTVSATNVKRTSSSVTIVETPSAASLVGWFPLPSAPREASSAGESGPLPRPSIAARTSWGIVSTGTEPSGARM
ncbi:hypothetical protein ACFPRL_36535 [Pseudoclavibacter helvolus]